jgi:hypothetical protein
MSNEESDLCSRHGDVVAPDRTFDFRCLFSVQFMPELSYVSRDIHVAGADPIRAIRMMLIDHVASRFVHKMATSHQSRVMTRKRSHEVY